ncbi:hypothetical protein [Actinomadura hibisca]|uniref:hypothetical protein n=1 Tax=Actinomadura hibisca TaxID=68565 RepID=UPI00082C9FC7|nr:hypothetical protein [Actinomadura hibisca]
MSRLVKIRLSGAPDDVDAVVDRLTAHLDVADVSAPYPNRRDDGVRRYLTVVMPEAPAAAPRPGGHDR